MAWASMVAWSLVPNLIRQILSTINLEGICIHTTTANRKAMIVTERRTIKTVDQWCRWGMAKINRMPWTIWIQRTSKDTTQTKRRTWRSCVSSVTTSTTGWRTVTKILIAWACTQMLFRTIWKRAPCHLQTTMLSKTATDCRKRVAAWTIDRMSQWIPR